MTRLMAIVGALLALVLGSCGTGGGGRPVAAPLAAGALATAATDDLSALAPSLAGGRHLAFRHYSANGPATWSRGAVGEIDLSGVAFDSNQTATLVTPRHVLMARHYQRKVGARLVFHDRSGKLHEAFLVAVRSGPTDIAVGQLDRPLPIRPYRVLSSRSDYGSLLEGVPVIVTNRQRLVFCHAVTSITGQGWIRLGPSRIPGVAGRLVVGDSGNPGFLLVDGEPILVETHTTGGFGGGPFFSDPQNFAAINRLIGQLGGSERLTVLEVR